MYPPHPPLDPSLSVLDFVNCKFVVVAVSCQLENIWSCQKYIVVKSSKLQFKLCTCMLENKQNCSVEAAIELRMSVPKTYLALQNIFNEKIKNVVYFSKIAFDT